MRPLLPERIVAAGHAIWAAGALLSALELGVFTELGKGPRTRLQLQRRLGLSSVSAPDFLDALVGLGWLDREGDDDDAVYLNTRESGHFLDRHQSHYLGDLLQAGHESLRANSVALTAMLRGRAVGAGRPDRPGRPALREHLARLHGDALAAAFDFSPCAHLLDIQGAAGRLACAIALANPHLRGTTLERAEQVSRAQDHIERCALGGRVAVATRPGALRLPAPLPAADVIVASLVLRADAMAWLPALLRQARAALTTGGCLLVIDHLLDDARRASAPAMLLSLSRRMNGEAHVPATRGDVRDACLGAGFSRTDCLGLVDGASAVIARL